MSSFIKNERGVVMMETILMLPVYLIIFGGLFWLGDLCLARLAFTEGETLRMWEEGLRHPFTPVPERTIFSFLPAIGPGQVLTGTGSFTFTRTTPPQTGGWGVGIAGNSSMLTRNSDWSWGATEGALRALGEKNTVERELKTTGAGKILLSRNDYSGRQSIYYDGKDNGTFWENEYGAVWTVGGAKIQLPSCGTPKSVPIYNNGSRNGNYNQWSL